MIGQRKCQCEVDTYCKVVWHTPLFVQFLQHMEGDHDIVFVRRQCEKKRNRKARKEGKRNRKAKKRGIERSVKARFLEHGRPSSASSEVSRNINKDKPEQDVHIDEARISLVRKSKLTREQYIYNPDDMVEAFNEHFKYK